MQILITKIKKKTISVKYTRSHMNL